LREALNTAGEWREDAGQIQKPPFEETTSVSIEYHRDKDTGAITTTDIKLSHADKLMVKEDTAEYKTIPIDEPFESGAMVIEFRAIDSMAKNKEGRPYRIENSIDIHHDIMSSPTSGHKIVKVKVIPPSVNLKFTTDGMDPANNGKPYAKPGIEAAEGATVRLFAEKGALTIEKTIPIPKTTEGGGTSAPTLAPTLPATVNGKGFSNLITRSATYQFLTSLPNDARLQKVQAKVTLAAADNTVTLTWDGKTRLAPDMVRDAFEFLDKQIEGGEWWLRFDQLHFATGTSLLQWQVDASTKIDPGQISQ